MCIELTEEYHEGSVCPERHVRRRVTLNPSVRPQVAFIYFCKILARERLEHLQGMGHVIHERVSRVLRVRCLYAGPTQLQTQNCAESTSQPKRM